MKVVPNFQKLIRVIERKLGRWTEYSTFTEKSEWNDYTRAVRKFPNVLWTHQTDMIAAHIMSA